MQWLGKTQPKRVLFLGIAAVFLSLFSSPQVAGIVKAAIGQFFWNGQAVTIHLPKDTFDASEKITVVLEHADTDHLALTIKDTAGTQHTVDTQFRQSGNEVVVTILPTNNLLPGKYSLVVTDTQHDTTTEQSFWWGVLAVNTNQSSYQPGEDVRLSIGVLDSNGGMVCDAGLELVVQGEGLAQPYTFSTADGSIQVNKECQIYGLTHNPDYEATLVAEQVGVYDVTITATTTEGSYSIRDSFLVQENPDFLVYRETATRIYPVVEYPVALEVTSQRDFRGTVIETVPASFAISTHTENKPTRVVDTQDGRKEISWNVDWKAGESYFLSYGYDAPDVSPELYTLGPLQLVGSDGEVVFAEPRTWSVAVDAVAFDAVSTTSSSLSVSHTTSGSDRLLLAFITLLSTGNPDVTSVTYNGTSMTKITEASNQYITNRFIETQVYQLVAPDTGSNTLAMTLPATYTDSSLVAISYTGVDQSTPIGATGTNTGTGDLTVTFNTNNADSLIVAGGGIRGGDAAPFSPGTGTTERWDYNTGAHTGFDFSAWGGEESAPTTGSYTVDSTSASTDSFSMVGVEVNQVAASGITVSGNVYNAGTSTALTECDGATSNVALRAGSTTYTTTCDDSTGAFSFSSVTAPSAGDGVVVWIDGAATDGALAFRYDGTGDATGYVFYDDTVVVSSDDATAIDTTDMDTYDSGGDADIPYTVTTSNLTVSSGHTLMVASGKTFDPGGTVTTNATGGNFHLDDNATAYLDTGTSTVGVDILVDDGATLYINATTTIGGGDITLTGTGSVTTDAGTPSTTISGAGTIGGGTGSLTFYDLSLSGTGTTTLSSGLTVNNNLTIGDGSNAKTLDIETNDNAVDVNGALNIAASATTSFSSTAAFTVQGSFTNNGTITENTSTITLDGSSAANLDSGCTTVSSCTSENFYILDIDKDSGATTVTLNSGLRTTNTLLISSGTLSQGQYDIQAEGTTAFQISSGSTLSNLSTGDLILGGQLNNSGTVTLQGNGAACGGADDISILSTSTGVQRPWLSTGTISINDAFIQDQGGTASITAESSTDNGNNDTNWTINSGCGPGPTNSQLLRHGGWFSGGIRQPFTF